MAGNVLGVDVGGTHMRAAVVAPDGAILERRREGTPAGDPHPQALDRLVREIAEEHRLQDAVIGLPGRVNYAAGVLEYAPHLPQGWLPDLNRARLQEATGVHVHVCNDAELAAAGEAAFGAGRGHEDVVYLTFSTGIGGGVVQGGRAVHGVRSMPEPGHTIVDVEAFEEGRPFSMEDFASGTGLARWAKEAGIGERADDLLDRLQAGDAEAARLWGLALRHIRAAVFNMAMMFSPQVVVIGGGVGLNAPGLVEDLRAWLAANPLHGLPPVAVERAALGDDAGLAGAAAWVGMFGEPAPG